MILQKTPDLRRINRSKALRQIYFHQPTSRLQVSQATGLSPATVTNVVSDMLEDEVLVESGLTESEGGRPSTLLEVNPDFAYFVGVDVGETMIQAELFNVTMQRLASIEHPLSQDEFQPDQIVDNISNSVESLLQRADVQHQQVMGVGIGFPGLVNPDSGVSIFAPNWGWHNVPLSAMLEERLDIPLLLDNGAKSMALAESMFGAGKGAGSVAVLLIGTGVGAGLVYNGSLFRGATNSAGEWGHMTIEMDGEPCRCGSRGCLEAYVGAPAVIRRFHRKAGLQHKQEDTDQMESLRSIVERASAGDEKAVAVIMDTARYLGVGVANLINLFNPEKVVLGGWVGMLMGNMILGEVQSTVSRYSLAQPLQNTSIGLCRFGQEAVAMGAATLVLDKYFETAGASRRALR